MAFLVSSETAKWLRAQMSPGDTRRRRRARAASAPVAGVAHPWKITTAPGETEGEIAVSVAPGTVAWGGAFNAVWPGGSVGTVPDGQTRLVVWQTKHAAVPLAFDPRFPDGSAPSCRCEDCDCMDKRGDPDKGEASAGTVELAESPYVRPDGVTDCRVIGSVSNAGGVATVVQRLWSEIAVRAIVRDGEEPGDDPDPAEGEDPPPCGNPLNGGGGGAEENPLDKEKEGGGEGGGDRKDDPTPPGERESNPLDKPGDGGFTPTCKDETSETEL